MKAVERMSREDLEEEVLFLRAELRADETAAEINRIRALGLAPADSRVLLQLMRRSPVAVSRANLFEISSRDGIDRDASLKIVDVYISRIRKIVGYNSVQTVWAYGYRLTTDGYAAVSAAIDAARLHA